MNLSRRHLIYASFFGAGALGLRSLATGIPRSVLADPLAPNKAFAQDAQRPRILILSTSRAGDPMNGNVPGTYGPGLENVVHPRTAEMAPTELSLGGQTFTAARPWAELPQGILDRTVFFHHSTYTNSHGNQPKVMRLMGNTRRDEMLVSIFAKATGEAMETTQLEPISLGASGGELLSFEGRTLSRVRPRALSQILGSPEGPLAELRDLRDRDVDRLYNLYRREGTPNQLRMLDRFAQSRQEARSISEALLDRLATVNNDNVGGQIQAAPILAAMGVSPVLSVRIPFGGDNHNDGGLARETEQTVSGVAAIRNLIETCDQLRSDGVLQNEVVFAGINVFGRTMSVERKGQNGRDHNARHHAAVLIGDSLRGGVIGGVEADNRDFSATSIDSSTGAGVPEDGGDIPFDETFQSMAKTLGVALGVEQGYLDENITGGRVIAPALR